MVSPELCRICSHIAHAPKRCGARVLPDLRVPPEQRGICGCPLWVSVPPEVAAGAAITVNHPSHYQANGLEAIHVIEAFGLGFHLGNVVKYALRAGRKGDAIEDLEKARWYLERELARRKGLGDAPEGGSTP